MVGSRFYYNNSIHQPITTTIGDWERPTKGQRGKGAT